MMANCKSKISRKSQAKYGFKPNGSPLHVFSFDWRTVQWDKTAPPKYPASEISRTLQKRFPRSFKLPTNTINQYFYNGRWPFALIRLPNGVSVRGMSEPNLEKVIAIFDAHCCFDLGTYFQKLNSSSRSSKTASYSVIRELDIAQQGLTTVQSSGYLRKHHKLQISPEGIRYLCKTHRIPSTMRNGYFKPELVYAIHPQHLDEYAEIKLREKAETEQSVGGNKPASNENNPSNDRDANWRAAVGVEVSQHRREIVDLKQEIETLRKELVALRSETETSINTATTRIDKIGEYTVTISSWLNEQFPNEFAVCCN